MSLLFSERRRADALADAIDDPQRDVDGELRALATLAGALTSVSAASRDAVPREQFAVDLRARLLAAADEVMVPGAPLALTPRSGTTRERRLVAAASVLVVLGGSAGMAAAAQGALPGDTLYPVKRGLERAEAGLSVSPAGKGRDLLDQAAGRLAEVRGLLSADRADSPLRVPAAVGDFVDQSHQGSTLLLDSYRETRDPAAVEDVRAFAAASVTELEELAALAPPSAQDSLRAAALTLQDIDRQATALCSTCAAGRPALRMPAVLLAAAEADRALAGVDAGALDNSHPFVVPKSSRGDGDRRQTVDAPGAPTDGTSPGARPSTGGGAPAGGGGSLLPTAPTPSTSASPAVPVAPSRPLGPSLPSAPGVPGLPAPSLPGGAAEDLGETVGGTVGDLGDGLSGVVETVLPDPVTGGSGGLLP